MPARLTDYVNLAEVRYPANWFSLLRLLLVPIAAIQLRRPGGRRKALLTSAIAMATDMFDGLLARSRGEVSNLGKILDPLSDKLFINSLALALAARGELPRWFARLLLLRDVAIVIGSALVFKRRAEIVVSQWLGKVTTALLGVSFLFYLLNAPRWGRRLLQLSLAPMALSLLQYTIKFVKLMRG
ncbi:MAG: CDP-alcohol phosphatidyltransferase [Herpetosiphonaceae bacterium]|nr:MAG: CDP-alcohol phosphatidyltransferase [Herpetosiphonaceae bacterium]